MRTIHPLPVRIFHWVNAAAILVMVGSGWKIYNASPIFDFLFPNSLTLGGWLAGALQWHFAAMWLLALNGLLYLAYGLGSGHLKRRMFPLSPRAVLADDWPGAAAYALSRTIHRATHAPAEEHLAATVALDDDDFPPLGIAYARRSPTVGSVGPRPG